MSTRSLVFAVTFLLAGLARGAEPVEIVADVPAGIPSVKRVDAITRGPKHHFVGYYGITPWDPAGKRMFCLATDVSDRLVRAGERAMVCLVDVATHEVSGSGMTSAWNLQQGAMLHWVSTTPGRFGLLLNDRVKGRLVSRMIDFDADTSRTIGRAVAAVNPGGRTAIGLNYDRLRQIRPVTGYAGGDIDRPLVNRPDDDGLFLIDMKSGKDRLLISIDAVCRAFPPPDAVADQPVWLEHAAFSRDGDQLFLIARATDPKSKQLISIPMVMRSDGTRLRSLDSWAIQGASHYDWLDARRLVLTREHAPTKWHHLLIDTDGVEPVKTLAPDVLTRDGHCTFSPDGRWMVTDTYPDENRRQHLFLLNVSTGVAARVGSFHTPPEYRGDWRCDLHPRWSRDSRQICIDSTHNGTRQVYVIELNVPPPM